MIHHKAHFKGIIRATHSADNACASSVMDHMRILRCVRHYLYPCVFAALADTSCWMQHPCHVRIGASCLKTGTKAVWGCCFGCALQDVHIEEALEKQTQLLDEALAKQEQHQSAMETVMAQVRFCWMAGWLNGLVGLIDFIRIVFDARDKLFALFLQSELGGALNDYGTYNTSL